MQVPKLEKVVVNMGVGEAVGDSKAGQFGSRRPRPRLRRSEACDHQGAQVDRELQASREGMAVGAKVTLRRQQMYEFLDRLVNIALPRVRDFRGLSPKSFDGRGNYALGIKEHIVFPEIDYDKIEQMWGLDIVVCTTARNDAEARSLAGRFRFPVQRQKR